MSMIYKIYIYNKNKFEINLNKYILYNNLELQFFKITLKNYLRTSIFKFLQLYIFSYVNL